MQKQWAVFIEDIDEPGTGWYFADSSGTPVIFDELDAARATCEVVGGFPVGLPT